VEFAAGAAVPVVGVPLHALFAVQVGVYGHGVGRGKVIDHAVGARPVAFGVPPERGQRGRKLARRLGLVQRRPEFLNRHGSLLPLGVEPRNRTLSRHFEPVYSFLRSLIPSTLCDLDHFQNKNPLIQMNHRSDEIS